MLDPEIERYLGYAERHFSRKELYAILSWLRGGCWPGTGLAGLRRIVDAIPGEVPLPGNGLNASFGGVLKLEGRERLLFLLDEGIAEGERLEERRRQEKLDAEHAERLRRMYEDSLWDAAAAKPSGSATGPGWLYIIRNPEIRGKLKIGITRRTPEERARELSRASGVLGEFRVLESWRVSDPEEAERRIHDRLASKRAAANREFFRVSPDEAREQVKAVLGGLRA